MPVYDLWTQDELDLLVAGTRKMDSRSGSPRVLTMIESGARKAELLGLQLGDFDLYRKTITVPAKGQAAPDSHLRRTRATVDEYLLTSTRCWSGCLRCTDFLWSASGRWATGSSGSSPSAASPTWLP